LPLMVDVVTFTHLSVRSHYSFLGSTASVQALVDHAQEDSMTHLALTDEAGLHGAVAFASACRKSDIHPIIGMIAPIQPPENFRMSEREQIQPGQLVFIAKNPAGYRSLCRLTNKLQAHHDREDRLSRGLHFDDLRANREGLICLTGGRRGWLYHAINANDEQLALRLITRLATVFGSDNVFLSLELHNENHLAIAHQITHLGSRFGLGTVAVHPVYCLSPDKAPILKLLTAIKHNNTLSDIQPHLLPDGGDKNITLHWQSTAEISDRYSAFPGALTQINNIISQCDYPLPGGKTIWPSIELPDGQTPDQALAELCSSGLVDLYGEPPSSKPAQRLKDELAAVQRSGFAPLFLIVADIARFAREAGVPTGSRGSVANSLVAYCARITNVDPVANHLLFERFLSPGRTDLPDIDLDFCSRRRDEILEYVRATYGPDHVALVGTINKLRLRSAVRETAKAYGLDTNAINKLIKKLPRRYHPGSRHIHPTTTEIISSLDDPHWQKVVEQASQIVGLPHHMGVHPGAVVITPTHLADFLPLQWATKGFLTTQYDFRDIEKIGLPKLDLLGISALTVMADAADLVRQHHNGSFKLENIPGNDPATGDLISRSDTIGIFQCESQGARGTLRKLKARSIRDLAVANAFFKPGPATGGMAAAFVRRYRGEESVRFLHPSLEPILGTTSGVLLFQEQILRIAREIAGLSWEGAGALRRGMSKMHSREMEGIKVSFIQGCQRLSPEGPELTLEQAERLWGQVVAFSGYGFNQGHATAYAAVSYRMAYLKTYWPAAYMCARLGNHGGFHHPAVYMAEAIRLGIEIRPPHINHSLKRFTLEWEDSTPTIWMGLDQVRQLRRTTIKIIIHQRKIAPFSDLLDFLQRGNLQPREITNLILCGALDGLGPSRSSLLSEAKEANIRHNPLQLPLFAQQPLNQETYTADTPQEKATWELKILGYPVSTLQKPLYGIVNNQPEVVPLSKLHVYAQHTKLAAGVRIPGWTGGKGFYLWDGDTWIIARLPDQLPSPEIWKPMVFRGRYMCDEWGSDWLQIEEIITTYQE
jgi:DNA polymerase III subunit alpha